MISKVALLLGSFFLGVTILACFTSLYPPRECMHIDQQGGFMYCHNPMVIYTPEQKVAVAVCFVVSAVLFAISVLTADR